MFPTQDPRQLSSAPDGDAPSGNELTTGGSDVKSGGQITGSSAKPDVVIVGGSSEVSLIGPTGLPLADEKTVISKRPLGSETPPPTPSRGSSTKAIGESLIGSQLDHYELVEFVGGGGMGSVFRARDIRLGREVAVKVLARDQTDDETIRRFRNEAQSAARLDHPNIA